MKRYDQKFNLVELDSYAGGKENTEITRELFRLVEHLNYTIVRVQLLKNRVCILHCSGYPEVIGKTYDWLEYLQITSEIFLEKESSRIMNSLSAEHLLELYREGEDSLSLYAPYIKNGELSGMALTVYFMREEEPLAYIVVRNSFRDYLKKRMIDLYVYNNCDYFIYMNAKNNSYITFSSKENGTPLPTDQSSDYEAEIEAYIRQYIVMEERETMLRETKIRHVLSQLEKNEVYSVYFGIRDSGHGYRRKRFDYRYYERSTQMILLSCTDVTEMYVEDKKRRRALIDALKSAQTDMLTGLLNYKGTVENVTEALEGKPEHAALLFLDLDNFKKVNDSFGHDVGDEVLCQVALILQENAPVNALIGRIGGDEFVIFFPDIETDEALAYAEQVRCGIIDMEYQGKNDDINLSCCIGIAELPKDGTDYKSLVKKADIRSYCAKKSGKNRVVIED